MKVKQVLIALIALSLAASLHAETGPLPPRTWRPGEEHSSAGGGGPHNVILFIGDGMGFEQVKAAGIYAHGTSGTLSFESLPYQGEVTTTSADNPVTDSAAAATAMATGFKVNNRVISVAIPGDGRDLETVLERLRDQGKSTGLVTIAYVTHATPAAFGAHESDRGLSLIHI